MVCVLAAANQSLRTSEADNAIFQQAARTSYRNTISILLTTSFLSRPNHIQRGRSNNCQKTLRPNLQCNHDQPTLRNNLLAQTCLPLSTRHKHGQVAKSEWAYLFAFQNDDVVP